MSPIKSGIVRLLPPDDDVTSANLCQNHRNHVSTSTPLEVRGELNFSVLTRLADSQSLMFAHLAEANFNAHLADSLARYACGSTSVSSRRLPCVSLTQVKVPARRGNRLAAHPPDGRAMGHHLPPCDC